MCCSHRNNTGHRSTSEASHAAPTSSGMRQRHWRGNRPRRDWPQQNDRAQRGSARGWCKTRPPSWSGDLELAHLPLEPHRTHMQLGEHAAQRPAPPDPQVLLHVGEAQPGQAGLPLGRQHSVCRAQHSVCRAIARWGRMVARWRGSRCWSRRSRTVAGCMPSSLAMLVVGHRRVTARSARYACSDGKPSAAARAVRCWSVLLRRLWAAVTWRGDGVMPAVSSRCRTTVGWCRARWPAAPGWPAAGSALPGSWQGRCAPAREHGCGSGADHRRGPQSLR